MIKTFITVKGKSERCPGKNIKLLPYVLQQCSSYLDITVITDSQYVIGCATLGWKRKKNVELWKRFDKAMNFHKSVIFKWTKGHSDNLYNNRCDALAVKASQLEL